MDAACQPPKVLSLVEEITQLASSTDASSARSHFRLLGLVDQLKLAVETPNETALRLMYQVSLAASLRSGLVADWNAAAAECRSSHRHRPGPLPIAGGKPRRAIGEGLGGSLGR